LYLAGIFEFGQVEMELCPDKIKLGVSKMDNPNTMQRRAFPNESDFLLFFEIA
jgi:hypothetical protein